jgi:hypothetical protein
MLGAPLAAETRGPSLIHFQLYAHSGTASHGTRDTSRALPDPSPIASVEMHADGTLYVAYTPSSGPCWYDTYLASEADGVKNSRIRAARRGSRPFARLKATNDDPGSWLSSSQAFPPGQGPAPRWLRINLPAGRKPTEWREILRSVSPRRLLRGPTPFFPAAGAYCSRRALGWMDLFHPGIPEWQTILPINAGGNQGQKMYHPGSGAPGTHPVTWDALMELMQSDPAKAQEILAWRGHHNRAEIRSHRIPWISSSVEGVVTNSFLSGGDFAGSHREAPSGYFLGYPPPKFAGKCGRLEAKNALCNDWIVDVKPDPESQFLLARYDHEPGRSKSRGHGNFTEELQGSLENEIEQWLVPVGYRPAPGDRIYMTGRWIVDCGHDDWHTELHPYELVVSSHLSGSSLQAAVVVTGAWCGGTLQFDIWPLARPNSLARLTWVRTPGIMQQLTVREELLPPDNPNHLHVKVVSQSGWAPLATGDYNEVFYHATRRLATRYRLRWFTPGRV